MQPHLAVQTGTCTPWHSHARLHATQSVRTIKYALTSEPPFPVAPPASLHQELIRPDQLHGLICFAVLDRLFVRSILPGSRIISLEEQEYHHLIL